MIRLLLTVILFCTGIATNAQNNNPQYNKPLADSLGADEYGMKMYMLVILKTGPSEIKDKPTVDSLFGGHLQNIGRLAKDGKMVVAGPLGKNDKTYRGIFILNVKTEAAAKELLETDPAIKAKLLDAEMYPWYGSAALTMYLPYHDKVQKSNF